MFDSLLSIIAPHLCYECEKAGSILCDNCKYNIVSDNFELCIFCGRPAGKLGLCGSCPTSYKRAWCVSERSGFLQKIIDSYKFYNNYAAHKILSELLLARIGILPSSAVIVPVPTVSAHVRQRGYDHTALIARHMARSSNAVYSPILGRSTKSVQRGKNRKERQAQARQAFCLNKPIDPVKVYLVVDDVITTGATLEACARLLKEAGATEIWAAAIARQPLD